MFGRLPSVKVTQDVNDGHQEISPCKYFIAIAILKIFKWKINRVNIFYIVRPEVPVDTIRFLQIKIIKIIHIPTIKIFKKSSPQNNGLKSLLSIHPQNLRSS